MSEPTTETLPDFDDETLYQVSLTKLDALVIATHLALASAILTGDYGTAMQTEQIATLANQKQTNAQAEELVRKINTVAKVFNSVEHHQVD